MGLEPSCLGEDVRGRYLHLTVLCILHSPPLHCVLMINSLMNVAPVVRTRKFQTKAKTLDGQTQLRQRFIQAGKALLKEFPQSTLSLRKVAESTGYSPSALYRYFSTKAELMYAIREDYLDQSVTYALARIPKDQNGVQRLRLGFEALVQFWVESLDEFRHVYSYRERDECDDGVKPELRDHSSIQAARGFCELLVRDFFHYHEIQLSDELLTQFTDSIVVATHGVVAIPLGSPSICYCSSAVMARSIVQAFIISWTGFVDFIKTHRLTREPTVRQFQKYIDAVADLS